MCRRILVRESSVGKRPTPCGTETCVPISLARTRRPRPAFTLADYIALVRAMVAAETAAAADPPDAVRRWLARTNVLSKPQRTFGTAQALRQWLADRNLQFRESPLPA